MSIHCPPPILINFYNLTASPYYGISLYNLYTHTNTFKKTYLNLTTIIRNLSFFSVPLVLRYSSLSGVSFDSCDALELTEVLNDAGLAGYLESDLPLCGDPGNLHLPWEAEFCGAVGTVDIYVLYVVCVAIFVNAIWCPGRSRKKNLKEEGRATATWAMWAMEVMKAMERKRRFGREVVRFSMPEFSSLKPWISCDFS